MKKIYFLFFLFIGLSQTTKAQFELSVYSEISIVTAGPGTEFYEAFGHSAIRIKDPVLRLDLIYNYGMFDYNAPGFYTNFTKGKLLYKLGRYPFDFFLNDYKADKRWLKQQVLELNQQEKNAFFSYLEKNASPENATYSYDPFFDNCATKLPAIIDEILERKTIFNFDDFEKDLSFRQLMNREIHWNTWGSFGVNLALGSKLDKKRNPEEYLYLPDYVYLTLKNSERFLNNQPVSLVKREDTLLEFEELQQKIAILNPFLVFTFIALLGLFITYQDYKKVKRTKWLDFFLFSTTGIVGVLILFLWFFTNHSTTPNNFNFLWAFAPNLIVAFLLLKNHPKKWLRFYGSFLLMLLLAMIILWLIGVQLFPISVIPFLILLAVRYLFLAKRLV